MIKLQEKITAQWQDALNLVLGIWLTISPWALGYAVQTTPAWNAHGVGVVIAVAALAALVAFQKWQELINAAFAAWLIVSPWILGFNTLSSATANQLVVGVLVGGLALWSASASDSGGFATKS